MARHLQIDIRQASSAVVLRLAGDLLAGDPCTSFHNAIERQIGDGVIKVVLNLGGIVHMDDDGIAELLNACRSLSDAGGGLKLSNLTERMKELAQLTGMSQLADVYADENLAIDSFGD